MSKADVSKVPEGKICYMEIPSINITESASFYGRVFGWNIRTRSDGAIAFDDVPKGVSGTWKLGKKSHEGSGLLIYIMVDDVAATIKKIEMGGGKVTEEISGKFPEFIAKFTDPSGNVFGIAQE